RINDCGANHLRRTGSRCLDVGAPRTVAALTVDALRNAAREQRLSAGAIRARRDLRITGVTRQAFIHDLSAEVRLLAAIEARVHAPMSVFLRVPGEGQLENPSFLSPM